MSGDRWRDPYDGAPHPDAWDPRDVDDEPGDLEDRDAWRAQPADSIPPQDRPEGIRRDR